MRGGDGVRPGRPARESKLAGFAFAATGFLLAIVVYYLPLGVVSLLSLTSGIGTPRAAEPAGFGLVANAIIYGGLLWAMAVAIIMYRIFGPAGSPLVRARTADGLIIVGCGLMSAVLCMLPVSVFVAEASLSRAFMTGAGFGFVVGSGFAWLFVARSQAAARRDLSVESGGL